MSFTSSPAKMAVIFIIAGIAIVFAILGTSATSIFVSSTTEDGMVEIKQADECVVRASDDIPRKISNCPYDQGQKISITYKSGQPNIESHRPLKDESVGSESGSGISDPTNSNTSMTSFSCLSYNQL